MTNNFEMMRKRLLWQGGLKQEERMIQDKYRSFLKSLDASYQACDVSLVQKYDSCVQVEESPQYRALINPNKLKQDYDDKILSIGNDSNFSVGDIIQWKGTNTNWIIYLEHLTEDAYFRGDIRLCKHKIRFAGTDGELYETWAAIRGPVETQIESIQKNQIRVNSPNWSLNILLPKNDETIKIFDRYSEFLLEGKCWRVEAVDSISMKNILEINAEEYYINKDTDDIDNLVKDGLIIEPIDPTPESGIEGLTFIKPQIEEVYKAPSAGGIWSVEGKVPVCLKINKDSSSVSVLWTKMTSGQFNLIWKSADNSIVLTKTIVVESLF